MVEEIIPNLYRIEIPLRGNPLKFINSYVIKTSDRHLIVDTGWNRPECQEVMETSLKKLEIDLKRMDFFIIHSHSDHLGLASELVQDHAKVYFNRPDADRLKRGISLEEFLPFARLNGFPEDELQAILKTHPGFRYRPEKYPLFHILEDGDTLRVGVYLFTCISTPGHGRGHMCLYERNAKILFSGDHLLDDITPNIQLWDDDWNPLKEYLESLDKVSQLDVKLVLPGHRKFVKGYTERIQELKDHHEERSKEILSILEKKEMTAFEVASEMEWDIVCDSWDLFPVSQKWFAVGEAIAHLKYLEEEKRITKETRGHRRIFRRSH